MRSLDKERWCDCYIVQDRCKEGFAECWREFWPPGGEDRWKSHLPNPLNEQWLYTGFAFWWRSEANRSLRAPRFPISCGTRQETKEMRVQSLDREDLLEEGTATLSRILAWRISMDRGTWWATVHGVAKSQTRLKQLSMHTRMWHKEAWNVLRRDGWLLMNFFSLGFMMLLWHISKAGLEMELTAPLSHTSAHSHQGSLKIGVGGDGEEGNGEQSPPPSCAAGSRKRLEDACSLCESQAGAREQLSPAQRAHLKATVLIVQLYLSSLSFGHHSHALLLPREHFSSC